MKANFTMEMDNLLLDLDERGVSKDVQVAILKLPQRTLTRRLGYIRRKGGVSNIDYAEKTERNRQKVSYRKPEFDQKQEIKLRRCLMCLKDFPSFGEGNQICPKCKKTSAWLTGYG